MKKRLNFVFHAGVVGYTPDTLQTKFEPILNAVQAFWNKAEAEGARNSPQEAPRALFVLEDRETPCPRMENAAEGRRGLYSAFPFHCSNDNFISERNNSFIRPLTDRPFACAWALIFSACAIGTVIASRA